MSSRRFALPLLIVLALGACSSHDNDDADTNGDASRRGAGGVAGSDLNGSDRNGQILATTLAGQQQELKQTVGDTIHFSYDSASVEGEGQQILQRQAAFMQRYPNLTFTIEGHCDQRGTREYNLALGDRRATAARVALTAMGISASRLQVVSYGKERPEVPGSTEQAWSQNRRAVTIID